MENELLNILNNFGFPALVSLFLMIRIEQRLILLSDNINKLSIVLENKLSL